ncbi:MAG TPA: calcium-binding protein [Tepidisphaeraceae bacterium]|nr:calcium-binding protein [Tepidisphaeraceae bacterium]
MFQEYGIEPLETRTLLSTVLRTGSTLRVGGDDGVENQIVLRMAADGDSITVTINGVSEDVTTDGLRKVRIAGRELDDTIRIDESAHVFDITCSIEGLAGNDFIVCGGANDFAYGGDGHDSIRLGNGRNKAFGEAGNDRLVGGRGRDLLVGGAGHDQLEGRAARDEITGDNGNDVLYGGDDADLIIGGRGDDLIFGDAGRDVLIGNTGSDTMFGGADHDTLFGNEDVDVLSGDAGRDSIWGGAGSDQISQGRGGGFTDHGELRDFETYMEEVLPDTEAE